MRVDSAFAETFPENPSDPPGRITCLGKGYSIMALGRLDEVLIQVPF